MSKSSHQSMPREGAPTTTRFTEIAVLFKIHRNTVRRWLASGLERVREGKGLTLVRGQALRTSCRFPKESV